MKTSLRMPLVALLTAVVFIVGCFLTMSRPHVRTTSQPVSLQAFQTESKTFSLPSSASNIWYAWSSVGMGGRASIYRFDASITDCWTYAQQLLTDSNTQTLADHTVSTQLVPLTAPPQTVDHDSLRRAYGLKATEWFDVENIHRGWEGRGPPSGLALIWIDAERERFYYYWTD
jgi:hypothetical protein